VNDELADVADVLAELTVAAELEKLAGEARNAMAVLVFAAGLGADDELADDELADERARNASDNDLVSVSIAFSTFC
jgi:hypothetical protein